MRQTFALQIGLGQQIWLFNYASLFAMNMRKLAKPVVYMFIAHPIAHDHRPGRELETAFANSA